MIIEITVVKLVGVLRNELKSVLSKHSIVMLFSCFNCIVVNG